MEEVGVRVGGGVCCISGCRWMPRCSRTKSTQLKGGGVQPASSIMQELTLSHTPTCPRTYTHSPLGNHHSKPMQKPWLTVAAVNRPRVKDWLIEQPIKLKEKKNFFQNLSTCSCDKSKTIIMFHRNPHYTHTHTDIWTQNKKCTDLC